MIHLNLHSLTFTHSLVMLTIRRRGSREDAEEDRQAHGRTDEPLGERKQAYGPRLRISLSLEACAGLDFGVGVGFGFGSG